MVTVDQKPNLIRHLHDLSGVWQTDITYIQLTNHRWVYLATVLDPEKSKVLGYKIGDTMTAELATSVLQMALDKHRKPLIIHSDMGSQYTSAEFNIKCQNYGLKHSYPAVEDIRGLGIMAGLTLTKPVNDVVSNLLLDEHIIVLSAGKNTLRLLTPLTIPTSQLLDTLEKIKIYLSK